MNAVQLLAKSAELHRREIERAREEVCRELRQKVRDALMGVEDLHGDHRTAGAMLLDKIRIDVGLLFCAPGDDAGRAEWVKFVKEFRAAVNDMEFERLHEQMHRERAALTG